MSEPAFKPTANLSTILRWLLLSVAAIFFILHFLHLRADFPNNSPWDDWSKYTDEGWYGDGAIRQVLFGHWYWKGDFNPAVALPVWPALEYLVFRIAGVSLTAARALTLFVFGLTLVIAWLLLHRHPTLETKTRPLAAPLAMLLLCTSPFLYAFNRTAIIEPLLICLTLLALLAASSLHLRLSGTWNLGPGTSAQPSAAERFRHTLPTIALALLLPTIILTKTTGICLFPAIFYLIWARAGYRLRPTLRLAIFPATIGTAIWIAYYILFAHRYLEDFRYIFSANGYTGFELAPLATVVLNTVSDGLWIGPILYPLFLAALALAVFWRPRLFANPLIPALLLWIAGYFAFLGYHNNLQPRYYLVIAVPITLIVALAIDCFATTRLTAILATAAVLAIAIPDAIRTLHFVRHPTYTFLTAAQGIRNVVLADKTHSHLILSISGSDLTLMTGLPSIDDDFGTMDLDERVRVYRPGWYAAWNQVDDDKMDALRPLYRLTRVAAFPAMDDPDRNLLILYRLDPATAPPPPPHRKPRTPKPLITKLGQQPTTQQLTH
ncbi:MAG TPA: hypothetical protein VIJ79_04095 [Acidobacteriaceae bacterium]